VICGQTAVFFGGFRRRILNHRDAENTEVTQKKPKILFSLNFSRRTEAMSKMGRYCKAYPIAKLHEFGDWAKYYRKPKEDRKVIGEVKEGVDSADDDYLFLQENFTVTKGIFLDEEIVFDKVTSEWEDFCKNTLNFEVPADVSAMSNS
jgi:hypothetical protein